MSPKKKLRGSVLLGTRIGSVPPVWTTELFRKTKIRYLYLSFPADEDIFRLQVLQLAQNLPDEKCNSCAKMQSLVKSHNK